MQRFRFLKKNWGLPVAVMLLSFRCVIYPDLQWNPLYIRFADQPIRIRKAFNPFFRMMCGSLFILLITQKTNAQTSDSVYTDTNYVDTTSMTNIDPSSVGYDDQDDGYVDTTVKHIYDTSQYFFNWKKYLDDPYTTEKFTQRHLIDAEVSALKKEDDFWYIPAIEKLETRLRNDPKFRDSLLHVRDRELMDENQKGLLYQPWFNTLLRIIIIGIFAAAIVYFLLQNKINLFSREAASSADETSEDQHEDIFSLSYTNLIQSAEKEKDYRIAVRLMFLQTLKLLSDTNIIHYQPDYTDLHYVQQLHQTKYYAEFFNVMRSYEYTWFGKFDVSTERYTAIKNDFLKLQHKIT
jgi:hypothetical protein